MAQANLRIRAVSPEPSLFAHMKYGSTRRIRPKIRHLAPTEDEKYHNNMTWLILKFKYLKFSHGDEQNPFEDFFAF